MLKKTIENRVAGIFINEENKLLIIISEGRWRNPLTGELLYTVPGAPIIPGEKSDVTLRRLVQEYNLEISSFRKLPESPLEVTDDINLDPSVRPRDMHFIEYLVKVKGKPNKGEWVSARKFYLEKGEETEPYTIKVINHHFNDIEKSNTQPK